MGEPMDFKKLVIYQIYPKSFMDSDGDGLGDLQGVISRLDHIQNLGCNCIWLTPIYISPQRDNGYDVADYTAIDPRYGSMDDFDELVKQCQKRDIFIMLDMVFNHTSDKHAWFQKALEGCSKHREYYFFVKSEKPPTNWASKFGGSAWEAVGDEYFLHLFDKSQPDLNWENPEVQAEVYAIMDFWLKKGIRGFRFDVVNLISKPEVFEDDFEGDGRRFYTDGRNVHKHLKSLNTNTFGKYQNTVTVGEMSSTTIDNCIKYSNPDEKELDMVFNFHHLKVDYKDGDKWSLKPFDFAQLKGILHTWQVGMERGGGWSALFWCNHDQPRAVSRFGDDSEYHEKSAKMLATAIHLMRGTPFIYQGEEIGMTNHYFDDINKYRDVESLNYFEILKAQGVAERDIMEILSKRSRDNARTPMQWDNTANAGFSAGLPWIEPASNYTEINAESALADDDSIFYHYKKLVELRKTHDIIAYGSYSPAFEEHANVFAYIRQLGDEKLLVVCNFFSEETQIDLGAIQVGDVLLSNYCDNIMNGSCMTLRPYEALAIWI